MVMPGTDIKVGEIKVRYRTQTYLYSKKLNVPFVRLIQAIRVFLNSSPAFSFSVFGLYFNLA